MNCQNFENIVDELARGRLMDVRTREAAHAHRDSCHACGARLAEEQSLRAGLRSLAAGMAGAEAPPRVEAKLLAAFREQAGQSAVASVDAPAAPASNPASNIAPLVRPARADRQWTWLKTLATAATAAAAAAVAMMIIPPGTGIDFSARDSGTVASKTGTPLNTPEAAPHVSKMIEPVTAFNGSKDELASAATKDEQPLVSSPSRGTGRAIATTPASYNPSAARRAQNAPRDGRSSASGGAERELVTEFMPLGTGDYSASVDAGQVVRVELPRSALSSIGMPVSADLAGERVKADVLVGEDGVARAIRFVR